MPVVVADVRFHCPSCGAALRTRPRDAGTVVPCHQCGEAVRAPRGIPAAESAPFVSAISAPQARQAARGCRHLEAALVAVALQVAVAAGGYLAWAAWLGPARLLERDPAGLFHRFLPFWAVEFALLLTQSVLKLRGYQLLAPAARPLGASAWLSAASVAVVLRFVGYSLACVPWLTGRPLEVVPMVWQAVAQVGQLTWMLGLVIEFAVLGLWYRVMAEVGGQTLARVVFRYTAANLGAFMALSAGLSLTLITVVAAVRKVTPEVRVPIARGARLNFAALPAADYWPLLALAGVALVIGLALALLYADLLRRARRGLLAITS